MKEVMLSKGPALAELQKHILNACKASSIMFHKFSNTVYINSFLSLLKLHFRHTPQLVCEFSGNIGSKMWNTTCSSSIVR